MAPNPAFRDFVAELLSPLGLVGVRAMFGGAGVFHGGTMFGLISRDTLYFKVGEANRADFEAAGAEPFLYRGRTGREIALGYYTVPADLFDDQEELVAWARKAIAVALAAAQKAPLARRRNEGPRGFRTKGATR